MVKIAKRLVNSQLANAKPKEKTYRLYDGGGLCLRVSKTGVKVWEYRYKNPDTKKDDTFVIGDYPFISLSEARQIHLEKKRQVFNGINPKDKSPDRTFETIYKKWFPIYADSVAEKTARQNNKLLYNYCMRYLAHLDITQITPNHIYQALVPIEQAGSLSQIKRAKSFMSLVFDFAIQIGLIENNPTLRIKSDAFKKHEEKPHRSLPLDQLYKMHDVFGDENVNITVRRAIEMALRTMLRLQEVVWMKWEYIDYDEMIIKIPKSVMKIKKRDHIVPITPQINTILEAQKNSSIYVFPNDEKQSIRKSLLTQTLNELQIDTTTHGFRHLASTFLNEARVDGAFTRLVDDDLVEKALAHSNKNKSQATYNIAEYIEPRRIMLSKWSDIIDRCTGFEENLKVLKELGITIV